MRRREVRRLTEAATAWDQTVVNRVLVDAMRRYGVVSTWTELVVPVLDVFGRRYNSHGGGIAVEHLFTGCVRTALSAVVSAQRRWDGYPPVVLACPDQEEHSLTLYAVAAALAEIGCPCRVLGASIPAEELAAAARRIVPRAVFLWSQSPTTAKPADLCRLPLRRPPIPVVVGGPGWRDQRLPDAILSADSLIQAVTTLSRQADISPVDVCHSPR